MPASDPTVVSSSSMYKHPKRGIMLRPGQACDACRAFKGRCIRDEQQSETLGGRACRRCLQSDIPCVYSKKRTRRSTARQPINNGPITPILLNRRPSSLPLGSDPDLQAIQAGTPESLLEVTLPSGLQRDTRQYDQTFQQPPASMETYLEPEDESAPGERGVPGRFLLSEIRLQNSVDPEVLGLLSSAEITWLFDRFTTRLSPLICLLDPDLHTLSFTRNEQPTLFLAIMFAATKFWHPNSHQLVKQLLETKISQATSTGNCHIATIQAIIILVFWQESEDRSVWLKSGLGIRMAYQAGLHRSTGMSHLPETVSDVRMLRNGQRTWYCLICVDRYYSHIFQLPPAIVDEMSGLRAWAANAQSSTWAIDNHLACSLELAPLLRAHENLTRSGLLLLDPMAAAQLIKLEESHLAYRQYWLLENCIRLNSTSLGLLSVHSAILECETDYARYILQPEDNTKSKWIDSCINALSALSHTSKRNDLEYWCVSAFTHYSRFGTMVLVVIPCCNRTQLSAISQPLEMICSGRSFDQNATIGNTWARVLKYYGRLYASLSNRLASLEAAEETSPSPVQLSHHGQIMVQQTNHHLMDHVFGVGSNGSLFEFEENFDALNPLWLYERADATENEHYTWL